MTPLLTYQLGTAQPAASFADGCLSSPTGVDRLVSPTGADRLNSPTGVDRLNSPTGVDRLVSPTGAGVEAFTAGRDAVLPYPVIQGHQVHDCRIAVVDRPDLTREDLEGYDAFVTALPNVAVGVRTADCVPILLYDPVKRVVAAVHSGWKGTVLHIVRKAIDVMSQRFGTDVADLFAEIGPAIGPDSFQVGEEVVDRFQAAGFPMTAIWSFRGPGDGTPMSGGHHIDLWQANRWLLEQSGVTPGRIHITPLDTFTTPALFSARREGPACGRNINAIKLLPPTR